MSKKQYRVRNWSQYNKALVNRGSLTVWFDQNSIEKWYDDSPTGQQGRPRLYSEIAILCALSLRSVFHLTLRSAQGLLMSLIELLNLPISAPDYTTLSRRQETLSVELPHTARTGAIDLVIDSTGLKIYGEGEWKVRQHGYSKRRTWRKLHLGINPETHMIEATVVTTNDFQDSEVFSDLLDQVSVGLNQVAADGAYDSHACYDALEARGAKANIPPREGAKIKTHGNCHSPPNQRDENLRIIRKLGRKKWKEQSGYHKRSLSETGMSRLKKIFTDKLANRTFENQATEALIKCRILNIMTKLGMPIAEMI